MTNSSKAFQLDCVYLILVSFCFSALFLVLDLARPPRGQSIDPVYEVVKCYLGNGGYLSQFVNFQTYDHGNPRDER